MDFTADVAKHARESRDLSAATGFPAESSEPENGVAIPLYAASSVIAKTLPGGGGVSNKAPTWAQGTLADLLRLSLMLKAAQAALHQTPTALEHTSYYNGMFSSGLIGITWLELSKPAIGRSALVVYYKGALP